MDDLETLIEKLVAQLGYELVDFETVNSGQILRVYIDKGDLISIEDCSKVSNHVNNVLSVETDFDYERLEVSSPGLDRVIKKIKDFILTMTSIRLKKIFKWQINFISIHYTQFEIFQ